MNLIDDLEFVLLHFYRTKGVWVRKWLKTQLFFMRSWKKSDLVRCFILLWFLHGIQLFGWQETNVSMKIEEKIENISPSLVSVSNFWKSLIVFPVIFQFFHHTDPKSRSSCHSFPFCLLYISFLCLKTKSSSLSSLCFFLSSQESVFDTFVGVI